MSSNTPTGNNKSFEESVEEGLKDTDLTPEEFDREEQQRRQRMARAFQHLADDAPEVSVGTPRRPRRR